MIRTLYYYPKSREKPVRFWAEKLYSLLNVPFTRRNRVATFIPRCSKPIAYLQREEYPSGENGRRGEIGGDRGVSKRKNFHSFLKKLHSVDRARTYIDWRSYIHRYIHRSLHWKSLLQSAPVWSSSVTPQKLLWLLGQKILQSSGWGHSHSAVI